MADLLREVISKNVPSTVGCIVPSRTSMVVGNQRWVCSEAVELPVCDAVVAMVLVMEDDERATRSSIAMRARFRK